MTSRPAAPPWNEKSEQQLETALSAERSRLEDAARSAVLLELEDFKRRVAEQQAVIVGARQAELALRAERRSLKEQLQTVELEVTRRVDDQRSQLEEAVGKRFADEYRLRIAEKDKALEDARHAYDELSRKLQQSSQQVQGEVLEIELESILRNAFPMDQLHPVPKGLSGADVIHKVLSRSGVLCGTIVWEAKRTKAWSDSFGCKKLKMINEPRKRNWRSSSRKHCRGNATISQGSRACG